MLRRISIALGALMVALVAAVCTRTASAVPQPALPASVVDITRPSTVNRYPTTDYGTTTDSSDDHSGITRWRVVQGTGNCCENYLTITRDGRLLDFGGTYINF